MGARICFALMMCHSEPFHRHRLRHLHLNLVCSQFQISFQLEHIDIALMTLSFGTAFRLALMAGLWIPSLCRVGRMEEEAILCRLWQVDILYEDAGAAQSYDCVDDNNMAYTLNLPSDSASEDMEAGAQVALTGVKDDSNAKIDLSPGTIGIAQIPDRHRGLVQTSGTSDVLVIRVNYRGSVPGLSASELAGRVFGLGKDTVGNDMAHQYSNCSFGKLKMKPFKGNGVTNGVAEIKIAHKISGNNVKVLQNDVFQAARKLVSLSSTQNSVTHSTIPPSTMT